MNYSKWKIEEYPGAIYKMFLSAGYTPLLSALLSSRGFQSVKQADEFLNGGEELLCDPMLLKDMDKAVPRIKKAIAQHETVAVYGDYDVDGITSTCLLTDWLRGRGLTCYPYIPDRIDEGYGINNGAVDKLAKKGVTLMISVDCGITAAAEAEHAKELGIDVIITDHHECREQTIPDAVAVIDPKQSDCPYPDKDLAGVGVALKLVCAVEGSSKSVIARYADLAAIGTVADVVPLTGENRYIVREGLKMLGHTSRPGIAALIRESGAGERAISSSTIGFTLAPRLNAAGRLGEISVAGRLLMTHDQREADKLAGELCDLNRRRQSLENDIWSDASSMMATKDKSAPIVLASEKWHQGVIGIAASKLAEQYSKPTIMICLDGEKGKGSCRSYGGFNLFDALAACSDYLESFGGHALAAGLNIRRDKIREFCRAFDEYYERNKPKEQPTLDCDFEVTDPKMLSMEGVASLSLLEPFGSCNPKPVLCMMSARLTKVTPIGGGKHLRININKDGTEFECVFFSHSESELGAKCGDGVDVAFTPQINEFHLRRSVQLQICAVRRHDPVPLCTRILEGDNVADDAARYCPDRGDFVRTWRTLQSLGGVVADDVAGVIAQCPPTVQPESFCICLRVLCELGLLRPVTEGSVFSSRTVAGCAKVNLESSKLIKRLKARRS